MSSTELITPEAPVVEPGTELTVEERVANGMAFLDERVPGWRERIDLSNLNVTDSEHCVLCQVFGDYGEGLVHQLRISTDQGERLGFCPYGRETVDAFATDAAWKSALAAKGTR